MQLLLKNTPILEIQDNGTCEILDFDRLPFALRKFVIHCPCLLRKYPYREETFIILQRADKSRIFILRNLPHWEQARKAGSAGAINCICIK